MPVLFPILARLLGGMAAGAAGGTGLASLGRIARIAGTAHSLISQFRDNRSGGEDQNSGVLQSRLSNNTDGIGGLLGKWKQRRAGDDESAIPEGRYILGNPRFPGQNYDPGIDGEFDYFKKYSKGGLATLGYNDGGEVQPQGMQAPQGAPQGQDQQLIQMAAAAIMGQIPNPEKILQAFVQRFGQQALMDLISKVKGQGGEQGGQQVSGPGDGLNDQVAGTLGGQEPVRLSDGEFVVPADVVSGIGNGSTDAGASALQEMLGRVRTARGTPKTGAPAIDPTQMMPQ